MFIVAGLVRFDSIVVIDSEGDSLHKFPHIYVNFLGSRGPFFSFYEYIEINQHHHIVVKGLKRVNKFPDAFSKPSIGVVHRDKVVHLDEHTLALLKKGSSWVDTLYDCDDRYQFLSPGDVIAVDKTEGAEGKRTLIKITNKRQESAKDYLEERKGDPTAGRNIEEQIGRKLDHNDTITIYEFKVVYEWQLKGN
jgi:hypothetical protein